MLEIFSFVCVCVCVYIYIYIYIYVYIYIYSLKAHTYAQQCAVHKWHAYMHTYIIVLGK
jgi:hypothetical protein